MRKNPHPDPLPEYRARGEMPCDSFTSARPIPDLTDVTASTRVFARHNILGPARRGHRQRWGRHTSRPWVLPAALALAAVVAAAVLAYGTRASLARYDSGVSVI